MHIPVFHSWVLEHFGTLEDEQIIDGTLGEGGHTRLLLKAGARVLALDADSEQIKRLAVSDPELCANTRCTIVNANFADIAQVALAHDYVSVHGVVLDLGLSMNQLRSSGGFSYKELHQPLHMVYTTVRAKMGAAGAADVVTYASKEELIDIFEKFGELGSASKIATAIVAYRAKHAIVTVEDFLKAIAGAAGEREYARIFQALRIAVNDEYESLKAGIAGASSVLKSGGILQVISFHSLEDRWVKTEARKCGLIPVDKISGKHESNYTFERSATVRAFKKSL